MNKKFVIYDLTGAILRTGECPASDWSLQAGEGEMILEAQACCMNDSVCPNTHVVIEGGATPPETVTPAVSTQPPALSTAMQLDLLWQAMDAGTYPKAEPFYSAIKATKAAA